MKHTHPNFPNSLLQHFNFDTNTTCAPTEASEEATATDEPEEEAEQEEDVESEEIEPFDQPEEEGDKSAIDSSPTEADDNFEKEREEHSISTHSKIRKKHIIQDEEEKDLKDEPCIPALSGKGKGKGKVKIATPLAFKDEMEQVDAELAAAATRVMPTPAEAKQLLDIIAAITAEGQPADASTLTHSQQNPRQPARTSSGQSNKRKGSTSKGTATTTLPQPKQTRSVSTTQPTPAKTPLASPVMKKTKTLPALSPQVSLKDKLCSASKNS